MEDIFIKILNMSITASYFVIALIILRAVFRKIPKWVSCVLWGLVGLRLILPFSFESILSLIPSSETIPSDITMSNNPQISSGIPVFNHVINPVISESFTPDPSYSVNPLQIITFVLSVLWITGLAAMLIYTLVSYILIKRKTRESIKTDDGTYICDTIGSPFILGIIKPKIYIPSSVSAEDKNLIIAHEKAHIKRLDHLWKPLGFLLLSVYWFNPLMWVAYIFLCRDIEAACDERVLKNGGAEIKKSYSEALINCSAPKRLVTACPLAFGETGVKQRIKNVLSYKKPTLWIIIFALIVSIILSACFMTNPGGTKINDIPGYEAIFKDVTKLQFFTGESRIYTTENPADELRALKKIKLGKAGDVLFGYDYKIEINDRFVLGIDEDFTFLKIYDNCYINNINGVINNPDSSPVPTSAVYSIQNPELIKEYFLPSDNSTIILNASDGVAPFSDYSGIYLSLNSAEINEEGVVSFNVNWHNETDKSATFGEMFRIEYISGTECIDITPRDSVWHTIAYLLKPDAVIPHTFTVSGLDLSLNGSYRFVTSLSIDGENKIDYECGFIFNITGTNGGLTGQNPSTDITIIPETDNMAEITEYEGVYISFDSIKVKNNGNTHFNITWHNETDRIVSHNGRLTLEYNDGTGYIKISPNATDDEEITCTVNPYSEQTATYIIPDIDLSRNGAYRITCSFSPDDGHGYITQIIFNLKKSESAFGDTENHTTVTVAKSLTLDDVIRLSEKGKDLTWSDIENFSYIETGSGLYIRAYKIDEKFSLTIGGTGTDMKPMYIYLNTYNDYIDIRGDDVTAFIEQNKDTPVPLPEICFGKREFPVDSTGENLNEIISYGSYLPIAYNKWKTYPTVRIDSYESFERFYRHFEKILDYSLMLEDTAFPFEQSVYMYGKDYHPEFFEEQSLLMIYVPAKNNMDRFEVLRLQKSEDKLYINIRENTYSDTDNSTPTGWLLAVEVYTSQLADITGIEAYVGETVNLPEPEITNYYTFISERGFWGRSFFLYDNGTFALDVHPFSSHIEFGTFEYQGDLLILTTDDDERRYVFEVNTDSVTFKREESTVHSFFTEEEVPDGAKFMLQ